jgi:hypothetical protein
VGDVRRKKEEAIEFEDFDTAASARIVERKLLAEKVRLVSAWLETVDIANLVDELDRMYQQAERLREILRVQDS